MAEAGSGFSARQLVQCPLSPFNYLVQAFAGSFDLGEDFFAGCFPDIAFWCQIAIAEITEDRVFEFLYAGEATGQDHILTQIAEEALHQV